MRRPLQLLFLLLVITAGAGKAHAWDVECELDLPPLRYCVAERSLPSGTGVGVVIFRNEDRTWEQPRVTLFFDLGQTEPAEYRFPGHPPRTWGGDAVATLEILRDLQTQSEIALIRADGRQEVVSLAGFRAAFQTLLQEAGARGFRPDDGFPLDRIERAVWFARRHVEGLLSVPGSAQFDYLEAFRQTERHVLVCIRFSALNMMGIRGRATGLMLRLAERHPVTDRSTHTLLSVVEEAQAAGNDFMTLWREGCRDR